MKLHVSITLNFISSSSPSPPHLSLTPSPPHPPPPHSCSPHVAHWAFPIFSSALANLPVCHEFCDEWFLACAEDLTCVENWITEWVRFNGQNYCPTNSTCRTFR